MNKHVFANDTASTFMNPRFVNYKMDMTDSANAKFLAAYEADRWPTFLFFNEKGDLKYRFSAGVSVNNFIGQAEVASSMRNIKSSDGVAFVKDGLTQILARAKTGNKYVFVDCYTDWCVPCAEMANIVFKQKKVGDYLNRNFINAKFEIEKTDDGKIIQQKCKIEEYPTFLVLDGDGKEVVRFIGADEADDFLRKVDARMKSAGISTAAP